MNTPTSSTITGIPSEQEIVKNAIRSAICIDDQYASPYETTEKLNSEDPKEMYYSFRKEGNCDLDIYRYKGVDEWNKHKYLLHNKDLLIQDWELQSSEEGGKAKYEETLPILKDIFDNNLIPFVVIYTNRQDLTEVSKELLTEFNSYNNDDFEIVKLEFVDRFSRLSESIENIEEFVEKAEIQNLFFNYVNSGKDKRQTLKKEFINLFIDYFSVEATPEKVEKKIFTSIKYIGDFSSTDEQFLALSNLCLSKERHKEDSSYNNVKVDIENLCYSINGTIVLILHKKNQIHDDGVSASNLFNAFSKAITNNPHTIINLVGMELKDRFREDFSKIGTRFNEVDESAFLYHAKNHLQLNKSTGETKFQKTAFKNFVVRSWIHELLQKNLDNSFRSVDLIEERITATPEFVVDEELKISLADYAAMVSNVYLKNKVNNKLGFGDLFKSGNDYFLCVTPHCDCFEPAKIKNQFYFIKNQGTVNLEKGLSEAEKGFFTFLSNGNKKPIIIEWSCKPFTSFVSNEMNNSKNKTIEFSNTSFDLEFVCTVKENYAQRIANETFSYGYRVGIDLPKILNHGDFGL